MIYELGIALVALGSLCKPRSQFLTRWRAPKAGKRPQVWIHAVSVGETRAIVPLAKHFDPQHLVISNVTATGHAEAKRLLPEAQHVYLPFDFPFLMRRIKPDLIIISETDFWAHFQSAPCPVVLVNGKLSERSMRRLCRFPKLAQKLLGSLDVLCVQSALYAERFTQCGVSKEKIHVTGNLKLDGLDQGTSACDDLMITLGSTHAPEEKMCLQALLPLLDQFPSLKLCIVPRHPHRAEEVRKLTSHERIEVVGEMGALRRCYAKSMLAFVGGSLTPKVGGHNLLEPVAYGIPVLYGPYTHAQPDLTQLVQQYGAGLCVTPETLRQTILELLTDPERCAQMGRGGQALMHASQGATEKTLQMISTVVPKGVVC